MPARSIIEQLPPELREWLQAELTRGGFSGYLELTERLNDKLRDAGLEVTVTKSTVHRFGQRIEENIRRIKASAEVARTLAREVGDDEGALNDAIIRMVQDKVFNVLMDMEVDPTEVNIIKLGHLVADLGRAAVQQKKHMAEVRAKMDEKLEALESEAKSGKSRLDPDTLKRVREEVYGLF